MDQLRPSSAPPVEAQPREIITNPIQVLTIISNTLRQQVKPVFDRHAASLGLSNADNPEAQEVGFLALEVDELQRIIYRYIDASQSRKDLQVQIAYGGSDPLLYLEPMTTVLDENNRFVTRAVTKTLERMKDISPQYFISLVKQSIEQEVMQRALILRELPGEHNNIHEDILENLVRGLTHYLEFKTITVESSKTDQHFVLQ